MKRTLLLSLLFAFLIGNQYTMAQESVIETKDFAVKCQNKVKKRRFKKLKENYEQALKDIEKIKSKAETDMFGYDDIARKAPNWIKMMNVLDKFPDHKLSFKEETITFEITDYQPLLEEAKTKANEAHYQYGVKVMDENKDNFNVRKNACDQFTAALEFSDNHKEDMMERGALIHYEEGLRVFTNGTSFSEKKESTKHFDNALKWKKPYKDIDQLMAKMYFDEAERLANTEEPENWKAALPLYNTAHKYVNDYNDVRAKYKAVKNKGAEYYFVKAKEQEAIHEFSSQLKAAEYYTESSEWVKDYKGSNELASLAKERATVRVFYYKAPGFENPNNITNPVIPGKNSTTEEEIEKAKKQWGYFKFPWNGKYQYVSLVPTESVKYSQSELDGGYVLVMIEKSEDPTYSVSPEFTKTKEVDAYTAKYLKEGDEQHIIDKLTYNLGLEANKLAYTGDFKKHTGTVTRISQGISASMLFIINIYDMRESGKCEKLFSINKNISVEHTVSNETYEGDPWARPSNLEVQGALKTKLQMWEILMKKVEDTDYIFSSAAPEIGNALKSQVKYIHTEK